MHRSLVLFTVLCVASPALAGRVIPPGGESGLRRLPRVEPVHVAGLWMLCHPDLKANARFRATRAAVADALRSHRALFAGCAGAPDGPEIAPEVVDEPLVR